VLNENTRIVELVKNAGTIKVFGMDMCYVWMTTGFLSVSKMKMLARLQTKCRNQARVG
jgi:hypothetical protein